MPADGDAVELDIPVQRELDPVRPRFVVAQQVSMLPSSAQAAG
jgi:hypothetical protein